MYFANIYFGDWVEFWNQFFFQFVGVQVKINSSQYFI